MYSITTALLSNLLLWFWVICVLALLIGTGRKKNYRLVSVIPLILVWVVFTKPVSDAILHPLESEYKMPDLGSINKNDVHKIVVLTGGGYPVRDGMLSSAFPHASAFRFLGGIELSSRLGGDCEIIFSGSAGRARRDLATAEVMKELTQLIAPRRHVQAEALSGSTAEHPRNVKSWVGSEPFLLVTSAIHMPRAMRTFKRAGLNPIPYPVDFLSVGGDYGWMDWMPSTENMWKLGAAVREYAALGFYTVMGW